MADQRNEEQEQFTGVYDEDVVQSKSTKKIGIVIQTAHDDDSSDSDDSTDEEEEKVEKGKIMVGWYTPNSKWSDPDEVKVVNENSVELVDRSLLPGDVVRWVNRSKGNQKGQIVDVTVYADVRIVGTNHVLKNINAAELLPLRDFGLYAPVVKSPWFGIVRDLNEEITLRLKNSSKCIISGKNIENLCDITDQREEESTFYCDLFYPGQQVQGPARVFKDAAWVVGSRPAVNNQMRLKAVVEHVSLNSLHIDWQVCGFMGGMENSLVQPDADINQRELQSGDVKLLSHHKEAHLQIGDKVYYVLKGSDMKFLQEDTNKKDKMAASLEKKPTAEGATADISEDEQNAEDSDFEPEPSPRSTLGPLPRRGGSRSRRRRHVRCATRKKRYQPTQQLKEGEKVCVEVCFTRTVANTIWQNGDEHANVSSTELHPVIHLDDLEFFPGDFVLDKRVDTSQKERFGVIQTANYTARLCKIKWLSYEKNATEMMEEVEDNVSVYDIADHEDYTFRAGDVVVRLASNDSDNTEAVAPAGQIIKVNGDGTVKVLWVDQGVSSVLPCQLYVVDKEDDEDMNWEEVNGNESNENSDDDEWETASDASDGLLPSEELSQQLNPLEDIIMRSLAVFNAPSQDTPSPDNNSASNDTSHVVGMNRQTADFINELRRNFVRASSVSHDTSPFTAGNQGTSPSSTDNLSSNTNAASSDSEYKTNESFISIFSDLRKTFERDTRILEFLDDLEEQVSEECENSSHSVDIVSRINEFITLQKTDSGLTTDLSKALQKLISSLSSENTSLDKENELVASPSEKGVGGESSENHTIQSHLSQPEHNDADNSECKKKKLDGGVLAETNNDVCGEESQDQNSFMTLDSAPTYHKFYTQYHVPSNMRSFNAAVMKDIKLLKSHLPPGILVRAFENRMDLFSVLIAGPPGTPYEDGLFYFDLQLPENYPAAPPQVHYYAYCSNRLNPNLYEEGKVCVSLLGTWSGKGNETWTSRSTIHQVLLSIQSLILCEEPYYNEAGYEKHRGSEEGLENSRMYNEMAVIKMMQSIQRMISRPPEIFKDEIMKHFQEHLPKIFTRFEAWKKGTTTQTKENTPAYPLFPLSEGFWASVKRILEDLKKLYENINKDVPQTS